MSANQSYGLAVAALYMALRAPENRLTDAIERAEDFGARLAPNELERAKNRAVDMFLEDAEGGLRRVEDILAAEA